MDTGGALRSTIDASQLTANKSIADANIIVDRHHSNTRNVGNSNVTNLRHIVPVTNKLQNTQQQQVINNGIFLNFNALK